MKSVKSNKLKLADACFCVIEVSTWSATARGFELSRFWTFLFHAQCASVILQLSWILPMQIVASWKHDQQKKTTGIGLYTPVIASHVTFMHTLTPRKISAKSWMPGGSGWLTRVDASSLISLRFSPIWFYVQSRFGKFLWSIISVPRPTRRAFRCPAKRNFVTATCTCRQTRCSLMLHGVIKSKCSWLRLCRSRLLNKSFICYRSWKSSAMAQRMSW